MLTQAEKAALRKSEGLRFGTHQWSLNGDARKHLLSLSQTSIQMQKRRKKRLSWPARIAVFLAFTVVTGLSALAAYAYFGS